ncbi:MAG: hypothetical protein KC931_05245 [Candidatus Omnitrophica bacterium]|nr:hypothetical protein [Candidatus Omnitrophota bacterium]
MGGDPAGIEEDAGGGDHGSAQRSASSSIQAPPPAQAATHPVGPSTDADPNRRHETAT